VDDQSIADAHKREFAWPAALAARAGLTPGRPRDVLAVVRVLKPTALVGTTGEAGAFPEEVVREMARHVERPRPENERIPQAVAAAMWEPACVPLDPV